MKSKPIRRLLLVAAALFAAWLLPSGIAVEAAEKNGLTKARELFQTNRWADARAEIRRNWGSLAPKDRGPAKFLVGRSFVREAEFYRGVRQFSIAVALEYLDELAGAKENVNIAWIPLFKGLHQLEAGMTREAERTLSSVLSLKALPDEWRSIARLRRAVARHRLGRPAGKVLAEEPGYEGQYWRLLLTGELPPADLGSPRSPPRDRFLGAYVLFRSGSAKMAEATLYGLDPDRPDVEDKIDKDKMLRFFDPVRLGVWERIAWERALATLKPLARSGTSVTGAEHKLATFYAALSLFYSGSPTEAGQLLKAFDARSLGAQLQTRATLLAEAASWDRRRPGATEVASLWEATRSNVDLVLFWSDLERPAVSRLEPFASQLQARLRDLPQSFPEPTDGALVGQWGLTQLDGDGDPGEIVAILSKFRNHSNKNKLEWNDPLLLLALTAANFKNNDYAQSLETLFELAKSFRGLRALQWNLQGIYAARQKAGGEARISN